MTKPLILRRWSVRWLRYGVGCFVAVMVSYGLTCAYVNWTYAKHWQQAKSAFEAEGETRNFKTLLPPRVDQASNFCAIEALDGIALASGEETPQGRRRKALEDLGWGGYKAPLLQGVNSYDEKMDFAAWARFARSTAFVQMPADSGNPARDLLQGLDQSQPLLKVLADAAPMYPDAAFTPQFQDRELPSPLVELPAPHSVAVFKAQKVLKLRAMVSVECGNEAAAHATVQAMLRLSDARLQGPLWIDLLMALGMHANAQDAVWSVLEKRHSNEEALRSLQTSLERLPFDRQPLAAFRGELAAFIDALDVGQRESGWWAYADFVTKQQILTPAPWAVNALRHLYPAGLVDEGKAVLVNLEYEGLIKPMKAGGYARLQQGESRMEEQLKEASVFLQPERVVLSHIMDWEKTIVEKFFGVLAVHRQSIIACALERYHLRHHSYPVALANLVPDYLSKVPNDPIDEKPMRYRQTRNQRYKLWSIGFDQKDNDANVNPFGPRFARDHHGDWVWQYELDID